MANTTSAKKALRQTEKRTEKNARMKKHVKTLYKRGLEAIKSNDLTKAKELTHSFQKAADKAAKTHVISTNQARSKKSRMMKALATAGETKKQA